MNLIARANDLHDPYTGIALAGFVDHAERVLGADHPQTLTSRNNLAGAYWHRGRRKEALQLFEDAAEHVEALFGSRHEVTRLLLANRNHAAQQLLAGERCCGWFIDRIRKAHTLLRVLFGLK